MNKTNKGGKGKDKRTGRDSYLEKGFKKVLTIYVSEKTHQALGDIAKADERSLQVTARRILEQGTKTPS